MSQSIGDGRTMTWADRLVLIDRFHPSPDQIEAAFGIAFEEIDLAREMIGEGILVGTPSPFVNSITADFFVSVPRSTSGLQLPVSTATVEDVTIPHWETYEPAPKQQIRAANGEMVDVPAKKRGRGGSKIRDALVSVPTVATDAEAFAARLGVSMPVLRQSKRFISALSAEDQAFIGQVFVRKDVETKMLMIWREPLV